jgi:hypothetical protein
MAASALDPSGARHRTGPSQAVPYPDSTSARARGEEDGAGEREDDECELAHLGCGSFRVLGRRLLARALGPGSIGRRRDAKTLR